MWYTFNTDGKVTIRDFFSSFYIPFLLKSLAYLEN